MELAGFGRRCCGRPLMLGVLQHAFRQSSLESEPSERALYEFGLRAARVRHYEAPWWRGYSGKVRIGTEMSHWNGIAQAAGMSCAAGPSKIARLRAIR